METDQVMHEAIRHIFLALCGNTPQVVTETLFALIHLRKCPVSEIYLITTLSGKEKAISSLLAPATGIFQQFCQDFPAAEQLQFTSDHILVPDLPIQDIQSSEDNAIMAELIFSVVKRLTHPDETILHASLAGGRKSMSAYLAMAMQVYGRPQDKLYHVLVYPATLEEDPGFYYPRPEEGWQRSGTPYWDCVNLIDIPFVRLRPLLAKDLLSVELSHPQLLQLAQSAIDSADNRPALILRNSMRTVFIGSREIRLRPFDFSVYYFFASIRLARGREEAFIPGGKHFRNEDALAIQKIYGDSNKKIHWEEIQQAISRIRRAILSVIQDSSMTEFYAISRLGVYHYKQYGILLPPQNILLA
ncbi:MAG TPA: CRISPR-associated ring nuclease Csm6 [bacterium]|nr:CRISPR-associated ring nuclease Csm6 [bacterium]HQJ66204.1 CRISPR-associated ring nuclease Csm6 [bacterium]